MFIFVFFADSPKRIRSLISTKFAIQFKKEKFTKSNPYRVATWQKKNARYPQIGYVILDDNCEVGCGSTIDRGSLSITIIGKNTFLDNQVHVAHNVKIGNNCIIAGQVGFAGSSTIGNNVMIGGQAGISGHLKIGNNVQIGGGSGVVKNIPDNSKVMGYPATDIKNFIKQIKK